MMEKEKITLFEIIICVLIAILVLFGMVEIHKSEEQMKTGMSQSLQLQQEQIEVLKNLEVKIR